MNDHKRDCEFEKRRHSHGSEVCVEERCQICNEGLWEKEFWIYPPEEVSPEEE